MTAEEMMELDLKLSEGLRNDPENWHRNAAQLQQHVPSQQEIAQNMDGMYELARYMQMRRHSSAIYSIKQQPYFT